MSVLFPKPKPWGGIARFELHLFNYATKADLKTFDTSKLAIKTDLASLKWDFDQLEMKKCWFK